jgi:hypothetical protein
MNLPPAEMCLPSCCTVCTLHVTSSFSLSVEECYGVCKRDNSKKNKLVLAYFIRMFMFQRMKHVFLCCLSANMTFFSWTISVH